MKEVELMGRKAKAASRKLAAFGTNVKNSALEAMASSLKDSRDSIMEANKRDIEKARKKGRSRAFIDRLTITSSRFEDMVNSILHVAKLPDPVGEVMRMWRRPNGLEIGKVRVPIGVIGIIYEARPNVSVDASCLCLKSGNSVILRGGTDAINSNLTIVDVLSKAAACAGIPDGSLQLVEDTSHRAVKALLQLDRYVDLIIPRGGEALIRVVTENSKIPVIKHYKGVCHVYVDSEADFKIAREVCFNAKVQRPGVCNAMETMLVHKKVARKFLKPMFKRFKTAGVEIRGCPEVRKIVSTVKKATEKDWSTEYLDLILSVKVVSSPEEAINHINTYGSGHSDAIITTNLNSARRFLTEVDSACVYVNASTRFTDGGEFGLGAEIGISTDKFHARGPMGLEELTTYKYIIYGDGQVRE
jgi:glutamate-5-semialdehyde dehydrogenase